MPGIQKGLPHRRWRRVQAAQDYLISQSRNLARAAVKAAKSSAERGNADTAIELLKHIAAVDEHGSERRPMSPSIDKPAAQMGEGASGPRILIGFNFPGAPTAMPAAPPLARIGAALDTIEAESIDTGPIEPAESPASSPEFTPVSSPLVPDRLTPSDK